MNNIQDEYFIGEWNIFQKNNYSGKLIIEKTGEAYKCIWTTIAEPIAHYVGIGIVSGNQLLISRVKRESEADILPEGGIGIYRSIGDNRSICALWAAMETFDTLGSGIALRQETNSSFEGAYKVRYFLKEHESPIFDLNITKQEKNVLYALTWSINKCIPFQHGLGMITNGEMVFAWGQIDVNWELIVLSLDNDGEYYLACSRGTQSDSIIFQEILRKS